VADLENLNFVFAWPDPVEDHVRVIDNTYRPSVSSGNWAADFRKRRQFLDEPMNALNHHLGSAGIRGGDVGMDFVQLPSGRF
jgi:hypothetical protein